VEAVRANRELRFKFPEPDLISLRLSTPSAPIVTLANSQIGWDEPSQPGRAIVKGSGEAILTDVTLQLTMKSRVAIVGPNGQGKSTLIAALMQAIAGDALYADAVTTAGGAAVSKPKAKTGGISVVKSKTASASSAAAHKPASSKTVAMAPVATSAVQPSTSDAAPANQVTVSTPFIRGEVTSNHNLRMAFVSQNHIDTLSNYLSSTPVEYARLVMMSGGTLEAPAAPANASAGVSGVADSRFTDTEIRAHLGMFGLGGDVALRTIGSLSGGQKARLAFAAACALKPHVLFLDEPTNHLSLEAMEALAVACRDFSGAVICASHNRHFLSLVCNELWIVDQKKVAVRIATTDPLGAKINEGSSSINASMNANVSLSTTDNDTSFVGLLTDYIDAATNA
jgi:elongation factor 3